MYNVKDIFGIYTFLRKVLMTVPINVASKKLVLGTAGLITVSALPVV